MSESFLEFAQIANAHDKKACKKIAQIMYGSLGERQHIQNQVAVLSEGLYRVASLLAYGNGWACLRDVAYFTKIESSEIYKVGKASIGSVEVTALLPHHSALSKVDSSLSVPSSYNQTCLRVVAKTHTTKDNEHQVFSLSAFGIKDQDESLEMVRLLGELIANHFAPSSYIGTFDGVPEFKGLKAYESPWLELSQLSRKQSPRICPACGKVVDSRVGERGGKPPLACCKQHIDSYNNEKKRLLKTSDTEMQFKPARELKARELRWRDKNNARPFRFPGIEDMEAEVQEVMAPRTYKELVPSVFVSEIDE